MRWWEPSRSLKAVLVAALLVGVALLAFVVPAPASASTSWPAVRTGVTDHFTLYGGVIPPTVGWGWAANNTTNPGPHLAVGLGDTVQLTLVSVDGATHNWFIAYDNSTSVSAGEPSSPDFSSSNSIVWNFTADRVGTFVYRCRYHPTDMTGLITISAPTHYTLYGSVLGPPGGPGIGWGLNATNISAPGPTLIIQEGANVTLTLYSADKIEHTWFIDYDNSSSVNNGEAQSPGFGAPSPSPLNYSFVATRAGTFAYRCGIHPNVMWGMIVIIGSGAGTGPAAFPIGLIPGIMLVVIVGVLMLAAVYQVRASHAARIKK